MFCEPPVDDLYEETFPYEGQVFSVEFLPGQFDQRADSAEQCIKLLREDEEAVVRTATTYVIEGDVSGEQMEAIKKHCINPVDSRETGMEKPDTLTDVYEEPADVMIFDGFIEKSEEDLRRLYDSLGLAMTFKDFLHIQNYFRGEEKRDPSVTEIRVLDTYWSDHCRHTTFSTELKNVTFADGYYRAPIEASYQDYLDNFKILYKDRDDKFVCQMDLALLGYEKAEGGGESWRIRRNLMRSTPAPSLFRWKWTARQRSGWSISRMRPTIIPLRLSLSEAQPPVLGARSAIPSRDAPMSIRPMRVTGAADPTVSVEGYHGGKASPEKAGKGGSSRLQFLRKSDRTGYRLCEKRFIIPTMWRSVWRSALSWVQLQGGRYSVSIRIRRSYHSAGRTYRT